MGKSTAYFYPTISSEITYHEKSFGFMVTKSTLKAADVPIKTKLQVLVNNMVFTAFVSITESKYIQHARTFLKQARNF